MKLLQALKPFLSELGDLSMMRLLSLICVLTACLIALIGISLNRNAADLALLCGAFLSAGIAGKVVQRKHEK